MDRATYLRVLSAMNAYFVLAGGDMLEHAPLLPFPPQREHAPFSGEYEPTQWGIARPKYRPARVWERPDGTYFVIINHQRIEVRLCD